MDVPGSIQYESPLVARFDIVGSDTFTRTDYTVTLFGDLDQQGVRPTITDLDGVRLDGEPTQFPSGDDTQGGNFIFHFNILGQVQSAQ